MRESLYDAQGFGVYYGYGRVNAAAALDAVTAKLVWDSDGDTTSTIGGSGTWNTTNENWRMGSAVGHLTHWIAGSEAVFGGSVGTVSLSAGESSVNSLAFAASDANNYTLAGEGSLSFSAAAGTITVPTGTMAVTTGGATATIDNPITADTLIKNGAGIIIINPPTGTVIIVTTNLDVHQGILRINGTLEAASTGDYLEWRGTLHVTVDGLVAYFGYINAHSLTMSTGCVITMGMPGTITPDGRAILAIQTLNAYSVHVGPYDAGVQYVTSPSANGTYGVQDRIYIDIAFDVPVVVDTTNGTPTLQLDTGGPSPAVATYVGGSGTSTLRFEYIVQEGDTTGPSELDYLKYWSASALVLNGGTIKDLAGLNVSTLLPDPAAIAQIRIVTS